MVVQAARRHDRLGGLFQGHPADRPAEHDRGRLRREGRLRELKAGAALAHDPIQKVAEDLSWISIIGAMASAQAVVAVPAFSVTFALPSTSIERVCPARATCRVSPRVTPTAPSRTRTARAPAL